MITKEKLFENSRVGKFVKKIEDIIDDGLVFCAEGNIRFLSILVYNYEPTTNSEQELKIINSEDENNHICTLNSVLYHCDNKYKPAKKVIESYKSLGYNITEEKVEEGLFKFTFDLNEVLTI